MHVRYLHAGADHLKTHAGSGFRTHVKDHIVQSFHRPVDQNHPLPCHERSVVRRRSDEQSYEGSMMRKDPGKQSAYPCELREFLRGSSHGFPCHQKRFLLRLDLAGAKLNVRLLTYRNQIHLLDQGSHPVQFQKKFHQQRESVQLCA